LLRTTGSATHHAVGLEDGLLTVNKSIMKDVDTDEPATNIVDLQKLLAKKPKKWPVNFGRAVDAQ